MLFFWGGGFTWVGKKNELFYINVPGVAARLRFHPPLDLVIFSLFWSWVGDHLVVFPNAVDQRMNLCE